MHDAIRLPITSDLLKRGGVVILAGLIALAPLSADLSIAAAYAQTHCSGEVGGANGGWGCPTGDGEYIYYNSDGTLDNGTNTAVEAPQSAVASGQGPLSGPASCSSTWDKLSSPVTCFWRGSMTFAAAGIIWMVSWLIVAAGKLFDWSIAVTVLDFSHIYSPAVNDAVALVWTSIRDLANIFIIGIFVFIAISIILGLQEFGQKKLIARVIIVSVLINFSFLFTQIAVNASNLFATAIIQSKAQQLKINPQDGTVTFQGSDSASGGVSGQFLKFAGAETFGDTWTALTYVAENNQSAWAALLHGLLVAVLLIAAAAVLFYGTFLLLARAIIILFLLMTSAFAFATYLSPTMAESDFGFKGWKDQLMRNVMLAPAMMVFLWATLQLASKIGDSSGTLGSLIRNPDATAGIGALFSYLLVIGLLYASLKISSSLSGMTGRAALGSTGLSLAFGAATGAWIGRNAIGRTAGRLSDTLKGSVKTQRDKIATMGASATAKDYAKLDRLMRTQKMAEGTSKKTFDARNAGLSSVLKSTGVPASLAQGTKRSADKDTHDVVHQAVDTAMKSAMTKSDAEKLAKAAHKDERGTAETAHSNAKGAYEAAQEEARRHREANQEKLKELNAGAEEAKNQKAELERTLRSGGGDRTSLEQQIREANSRIERYRNDAKPITTRMQELRNLESTKRQALNDAKRDLTKVSEKESASSTAYLRNNQKTVQEIGKRNVGGLFSQTLRAAMGNVVLQTEAHHVDEDLEKKTSKKGIELREEAEKKKAIAELNKPAHTESHAGGGAAHDDHGGGAEKH